ncbi:MAG: DinB family protein [Acidobacteriota bacterium]
MANEALIAELEQEASATRRLLERVPEAHLGWRPHARSMSLGQLALHVAMIPGDLSQLAGLDGLDAAAVSFEPPVPRNADELLSSLDRSIASATEFLGKLTQSQAEAPWRLTLRGQEVFTVPRLGLVRTLMLNHWYHHRGQLAVYLRLLDIPVPAVYGRSADENPFA